MFIADWSGSLVKGSTVGGLDSAGATGGAAINSEISEIASAT